MIYHGKTLREAYEFIKERRPIIHPRDNFLRELGVLEEELGLRAAGTPPTLTPDDIAPDSFINLDPDSVNVKGFRAAQVDPAQAAREEIRRMKE